MSLTGSVSENMLLTIGNPNLVLYMVGLSVATKLEGEKKPTEKTQRTRESIFVQLCSPNIVTHCFSHSNSMPWGCWHRKVSV